MIPGGALAGARIAHRLVVRSLVLKAGKLNDPVYNVNVKGLGEFLASGFSAAAKPAAEKAIAAVLQAQAAGAPPEELATTLSTTLSAELGAVGHEEANHAAPTVQAVIEAVYALGKEEGSLGPSKVTGVFSQADEHALGGLNRVGLLWIGDSYGDGAFDLDSLKKHVEGGLKSGIGREAVGDLLRASVGAQFERAPSYWRGLAATVATRARSFGCLERLHEQGITEYEYVNPMDERTSEICRYMDGKRFQVKDARAQRDRLLDATTPDAWKAIAPWPRKADWHDDTGSPLDATGLARRGILVPPLHFHCRSSIQVVFSSQEEEPLPELPSGFEGVPLPELPADGPAPGEFPFDLDAMDCPRGQGSYGGAHVKTQVIAPDGSVWLIKPYNHHTTTDAFRARADVFASDLAHALDVPGADAYRIEIPPGHPALREMGIRTDRPIVASIQRWNTNSTGAIKGTEIRKLSADQVFHVQREHAFDWLIGNHDGHGGNLLALDDGSILGIDKGQAFRFFGKDSLDWEYNPNAPYEIGYMNAEARKYAAGEYGKGFTLKGPGKANPRLLAFLESVRDMPDEEFLALVRPYAEEASASGVRWAGFGREEFERRLLDRKRGIVDEVGGFYKRLEAARKAALPKPIPKPKAIVALDKAFAESVDGTGWEGRSLYMADHGKIRSGNLLIYGMDGDGTIVEAYLTPDGEAALAGVLGGPTAQVEAGARAVVDAEGDAVFSPMLAAVKHFKSHLLAGGDGKLKLDKIGSLVDQLDKLATLESTGTPEEKAMAAHYVAYWDAILNEDHSVQLSAKYLIEVLQDNSSETIAAVAKENLAKGGADRVFDAFKARPTARSAPKPVAEGYTVTVGKTHEWNNRINNGRIAYDGEQGRSYVDATSWEITTPSGTRVLYSPHAGNGFTSGGTEFAHAKAAGKAGRIRILLDGPTSKLTPDQIQGAIDRLADLGVGAKLADPLDAEAAYLRKVTYLAKLEEDPAFAVAADAPAAKVVDQLRAAWASRLKVDDVRKLPGYDPLPNGKAGWGHWTRFDVDPELAKQYRLDHELSGGVESIRTILQGARGFVSTETRVRIGIPILRPDGRSIGLSPIEDQGSGGSTGFFTRVVDGSRELRPGHVRFKPSALLDADNRIYGTDMMHKHDNPAVRRAEHKGTLDRATLERLAGIGGNETLVWQGIPLDQIDAIGVASKRERDSVLAAFAEAGITKLGGKAVGSVVVVAN